MLLAGTNIQHNPEQHYIRGSFLQQRGGYMGEVFLIFGTLVILNIGIVSEVSDSWYPAEGEVEIENTSAEEKEEE